MPGRIDRRSGIPFLRGWVWATATIGRMAPPLLLIYVMFFGVGHLVVTRFGWTVDSFLVAAACLFTVRGMFHGLRPARRQRSAQGTTTRFYPALENLPQALRLAYTPVVAILINVVKATGIASVIAVPELISTSTAIIAEHGNTGVMINVLMLIYFLLVLLTVRLFAVIERRVLQRDLH